MSLRLQKLGPIPEDTKRIVRAAHRKGHPYIAFADIFDDLFECDDFSHLYSNLGQSSIHPARLALATLLQFSNGYSDRQAAEATRDSLLWKYFLRLELDDSGWDSSVFCEFRKRLLEGNCENLLLDKMLHIAEEKGFLDQSQQRTDSTKVISVAKSLNRLELVHEGFHSCLEELVDVDIEFVRNIQKNEWHERYYLCRPFNYRLPNTDTARAKLAVVIGADISFLLNRIDQSSDDRIKNLQSVLSLKRIFEENYSQDKRKGPPKFKERKS